MKIREVIQVLEEWAPPILQETYDNSGLYCGHMEAETQGALVCLDVTDEVIEEALAKGIHLIIAHHPLIFKPLKNLVPKNETQRLLYKAIKNDLAIYGIHTNLDNVLHGVNGIVAEKLGLEKVEILAPGKDELLKLAVFVPNSHVAAVQKALFDAGTGSIGNYTDCSFNAQGEGTFTAMEHAQPYVGQKHQLHTEPETKIEVILPSRILPQALQQMKKAHPYEAVAYDIYALKNPDPTTGAGIVGELKQAVATSDFLYDLKKIFGIPYIKCTQKTPKTVKRIGFCGGSGAFLIPVAQQKGCDLYLSADIKYHDFFAANEAFGIVDLGHYESEQFTMELIIKYLSEKLITFAACKTEVITNPVKIF